jgi:hypothetical protein
MARRREEKNESFTERLKEISRFFAGCSQVHKAMRRLVTRFERFAIPYAIVGGMAVNAHGHQQTTDDVDVLLTPEGFTRFKALFLRTKYDLMSGRWWQFVDRINGIKVDAVLAGETVAFTRVLPILYPDPSTVAEIIDHVCYVNLRTLIELKLAMRRYRDLGDVGALIGVHHLNESFMEQLHPAVHDDYLLCLEETRREQEYQARNG